MTKPAELAQELHDALGHLYDPEYEPSLGVQSALGCAFGSTALTVQSALLHAIEEAQPPTDIPLGSRARLAHDVLRSRYVLRLTQEETAERLHVSVTSVWRLQREAIHALALSLREQSRRDSSPGAQVPDRDKSGPSLSGWRAQTRDELAALHAGSPDRVAEIGHAIDGVLDLIGPWIERHHVSVNVAHVQPDLVAAVHTTVLRQVLITAIRTLAEHALPGAITLYGGLEDGKVRISLSVAIENGSTDAIQELLRQPLAPREATFDVTVSGNQAFVVLSLPTMGTCTVLVVDDNPDTVQFYRRATEGTNFRIVHCARGMAVFDTVGDTNPDIIVLDVMLPDVDGWELLTRLRQHPGTMEIPVVLCSVVREEELALALGAALFLSKPVRPEEFVRALERAAGIPRSEEAT